MKLANPAVDIFEMENLWIMGLQPINYHTMGTSKQAVTESGKNSVRSFIVSYNSIAQKCLPSIMSINLGVSNNCMGNLNYYTVDSSLKLGLACESIRTESCISRP